VTEPRSIYRERIWPSPALPSFLMFMGASLAIAYQRAYHGHVGLVTLALAIGVTSLITVASSPVVEITPDSLILGKAQIPRVHVGQVAVLDAEQTKKSLGVLGHHDAFIVTRSGIPNSIIVQIVDENDPHPYWQFSTRKPHKVASALEFRPLV